MDKCVFCGWSRRAAYPAVRFFGIPKEPGMKRVQWLHAIGNREFTNKDRVCSIHFRSGRPSSDPSHEDFVPHLYLNREAPPEMIHYLDRLVDNKIDDYMESDYKASLSMTSVSPVLEYNRACRPKILKRKYRNSGTSGPSKPEIKQDVSEEPTQSVSTSQPAPLTAPTTSNGVIGRPMMVNLSSSSGQVKRVKLQLLQRPIAEAAGIKPGQTVIIKRRVPVLKSTLQRLEIKNEAPNVPGENIIVAEEQTV